MTNKSPLVSVCVQTYNQVGYIEQCLDSLLMQKTTFRFEIILGEDHSSDGTREICQQYAAKYPEIIRLFLRKREDVIYINNNPTGRYNFTQNLKAARGNYIALCEGDDYWTNPLKLQKQVDFLESNPSYAICFHSVSVFNQATKQLEKDTITQKVAQTTSILDLISGNYIHTPSVMFTNTFTIPHWFFSCPIGDYPLYCLLIKEKKIYKIEEDMAVYRVHNKGAMHRIKTLDLHKKSKHTTSLVKMNLHLFKDTKVLQFKNNAANMFYNYLKTLLEDNQKAMAKKFVLSLLPTYFYMVSKRKAIYATLVLVAPQYVKKKII